MRGMVKLETRLRCGLAAFCARAQMFLKGLLLCFCYAMYIWGAWDAQKVMKIGTCQTWRKLQSSTVIWIRHGASSIASPNACHDSSKISLIFKKFGGNIVLIFRNIMLFVWIFFDWQKVSHPEFCALIFKDLGCTKLLNVAAPNCTPNAW